MSVPTGKITVELPGSHAFVTAEYFSAADPAHLRAELAEIVEQLLDQRGAEHPLDYIWGGTSLDTGCDCSGFVVALCRGLSTPLPLGRPTAGDDWQRLEHVEVPEPGDLAFYGDPDPTQSAHHVMVVLAGGRVAGMSGGGRKTTTVEIARAHDARLKEHPTASYRPDLIGYRRLPFDKSPGVLPG